MAPVIKRAWENIKKAGAEPAMDEWMMLSYDPSPWRGEHYFSVTKEVPGAENVKLSGTFLTKVFEGPFKEAGKWFKQMEEYVEGKGLELSLRLLTKNRFRYSAANVGVSVAALKMAVEHSKQRSTFGKLLRLAMDGIFSFSTIPIRTATYIGVAVSIIALAGAVFTLLQRIFAEQFAKIGLGPVPGFATIVISILFLAGVQLIYLGILGEYLSRTYDEVKRRPLWVAREKLGIKTNAMDSKTQRANAQPDILPNNQHTNRYDHSSIITRILCGI